MSEFVVEKKDVESFSYEKEDVKSSSFSYEKEVEAFPPRFEENEEEEEEDDDDDEDEDMEEGEDEKDKWHECWSLAARILRIFRKEGNTE